MRRTMVWSSVVAVAMKAAARAVVSYLRMEREEVPDEAPGYQDGRGQKHRGPAKGISRKMVRPVPGRGTQGETGGPPGGFGHGPGDDDTEGGEEPLGAAGEGGEAEDCEACADPWPLTADGIQGAVQSSLDDIKECYDQWLRLEPDVAGSVVVTFTITPVDAERGEITAIEVADSDLDHPFIEGCVLNVFSDMPFEAPEDGGEVQVNYPLMFDSADPPEGAGGEGDEAIEDPAEG